MKGTLPTPSLCLSSMLLLSAAAGGAENIFALAAAARIGLGFR
jgi:hypothetical protein